MDGKERFDWSYRWDLWEEYDYWLIEEDNFGIL